MKVFDVIEDKGFGEAKVVVATFTDEQVALDVADGKRLRTPRNAFGASTTYYVLENEVPEKTLEAWLENCTG